MISGLNQVDGCVSTSFSWRNATLLEGRSTFVYLSLVGRHLGCSRLLSAVNNAAINNHVQVFNFCFHVFGVHVPRST